MFIHPHAEEVELHRGSQMAPIFSTTGRRNRTADAVNDNAKNSSEVHLQESTSLSDQHIDINTRTLEPSPPPLNPKATANVSTPSASSHKHRYQCYDMFGFTVTAEEKAAEDYVRKHHDYSEHQLSQWDDIVANWNGASDKRLKRLCRRGVPQPHRRVVWQRLLGSWGVKERHPSEYARLRDQELASKDLAGVIERDLDRTFPTNRLFEDGASGMGQRMLRNILRAYANYDTSVGYCQGMGFLAATLILQVESEEDAFWGLVAVMKKEKYNMAAIFAPGFPRLQCTFYVFESLMRKTLPQLYRHLHGTHQIPPSFYAVHWFMTVFTYYFNFGLVSRIWDMFLCEGWKPVYRIALALMRLEEKRLLALGSETEILLALKVIQEAKKPVELLETALKIKFKTANVAKKTAEYEAQMTKQ